MPILITGARPSTGGKLECHLARVSALLAICASPTELQALTKVCLLADVVAKA